MSAFLTSSYTGIGDRKKENQDSILCKTAEGEKHIAAICIVADGCGGMESGDVISNFITSSFNRMWEKNLKTKFTQGKNSRKEIDKILEDAIENINKEAVKISEESGKKSGSTISLLLIVDNRFYIKNIGDSRVYRLRGNIEQLTEDQTVVADMVRNGEITKEEALTHKKRHVLSMCIGYFKRVRTHSNSGRIRKNDVFLVCCDGLYNAIDTEKMKRIINECSNRDFDNLGMKLRTAIPLGDARDNISAVLINCRRGWLF